MALLTQGIPPQPYGYSERKVTLPVKASAQIYEGSLVAQIAGACVAASTSGAGDIIGIAEHDQLGGASDGAKRISLLTDAIFLLKNGVAAFSDATPYGTLAFVEDDNSVGTGGLGATQQCAGRFVGFEDDGRVRVYISEGGSSESFGAQTQQVPGSAAVTATATVQRQGRMTRYSAAAFAAAVSLTLGTTGAVKGDIIRVVRTDVGANALTLLNGGAGAGTICILPVSTKGFAEAYFDGTNWLYDASGTST